jgi:hypothetical protein
MNRDVSCRPVSLLLPVRLVFSPRLAWIACSLLLLGLGRISAQEPNPNDWDFDIKTDKTEYNPGDALQATAGIVARKAGVQGWSFGVKHDTTLLTIESVTSDGTDVPSVFNNGFNQTAIVEKAGAKAGYIQAIVLSFLTPAEVPLSDFFRTALAKYKVSAGACTGKADDFKTKIEYTEELGVPNSPPVDLNLTVGGKAVVPAKVLNAEPTIKCKSIGGGGLVLKFDPANSDLVADKSAVVSVNVQLENTQTSGGFDVQGWSYGIQLDANELEATAGEPGADSKALNGGQGPDFVSYNLNDQDAAGTVRGVSVGAVIETDAPGTAVLAVAPGATKHIDTIKVRSKQTIPAGGQSRTTQLKFTDKLGGDRPLEVLIVVAGQGVAPDFTGTKNLNLLPSGQAPRPKFIRGDANNDARLDIADGIWIINNLFYAGPDTACKPAADSNNDGLRNIADAVYLFNYQLQPGATPSTIFPPPPAPFPNCGSVDGVTTAECPDGSTTCG